MDKHETAFLEAEARFLESEGVVGTSQMVDLPRLGGRVRIVEAGEGPPLLFVPGAMSTGVVFANVVAQLPHRRCLMMERPGTGLSPALPDAPTSLPDHKATGDTLLVDVLDGLDIEEADVVSTSLGGWFTFRGAAAHPDRFDRICALAFQVGARLESAPLIMRMPAPGALLPGRLPVGRRAVRTMLKSAGLRPTFDSGKFTDAGLDFVVAMLRHTPTFRNENLYNPQPVDMGGAVEAVWHDEDLLARVTSPVHLFWGSDDLFGGETAARAFAAALPEATVEIVPGAGHAPWLDEPQQAVAAIRRHLDAE